MYQIFLIRMWNREINTHIHCKKLYELKITTKDTFEPTFDLSLILLICHFKNTYLTWGLLNDFLFQTT